MTVMVKISDVLAVAAERPPGYVEAILSAGVRDETGEWLTLEGERLTAVQAKFGLPSTAADRGCTGCGR